MSDAIVAIVAIGIGTFVVRGSFLAFADRAGALSPPVERVLRMIPPAALAAIIGLQLADPDGSTGLAARLLAAAAAVAITWRTSNLVAALVVGMVLVVALDALV